MSLLDSLKAAGSSIAGVAKVFGKNLREDRAANPSSTGEQSLSQRARDVAGSVTRAAKQTADTPEFNAAKDDVTKAFQETRTEVEGRINQARSANGKSAAPEASAPGAPGNSNPVDSNIVDGEVVGEVVDEKTDGGKA